MSRKKIIIIAVLAALLAGRIFYLFYYKGMLEEKALAECRELEKTSTEEADICYLSLGYEYSDLQYCEAIVGLNEKDNCYAVIGQEGKDPGTCEKISNQPSRDACYLNVAENLLSPALCSNVTDAKTRKMCEENAKSDFFIELPGF